MNHNEPKLLVVEDFIDDQMDLFETLRDGVEWDRTMAARLTASFGVPYNYVQMVYPAAPMFEALEPVVEQLDAALGIRFNNCLLNFYQSERDKIGFHSDDTTDLVPETGVAIVSLGFTRNLTFRRRDNIEVRHVVTLKPGSMLFMGLAVQDEWAHSIKRQKRPAGPRISLTWRQFLES